MTEPVLVQTSLAWACVNRYGGIANDTIRAYRCDSIKAFSEGMNSPWRYWQRKHGWSCRRILIGDPAILVEHTL